MRFRLRLRGGYRFLHQWLIYCLEKRFHLLQHSPGNDVVDAASIQKSLTAFLLSAVTLSLAQFNLLMHEGISYKVHYVITMRICF